MTRTKKKKNDTKTLERQRELAKERQRRRRAKMTEEEVALKRTKDRERYAKLKSENKIKKVKDMTEREHRKIKKQWRERKQKSNLNKKRINAVVDLSPPNSGDEEIMYHSEQKKRGRKAVRKDRSKAYRKIKNQEEEIKKLRKKLHKYKMRLTRAKRQKEKTLGSPSPTKKVKKLIGKEKVSPKIRKQLFLGYTLRKQIKNQVCKLKSKSKQQQLISKAIGNKVFKRYRVQKYFQDIIPYKINKRIGDNTFEYERKRKKCIADLHKVSVMKFYEDDTVSRMCPGKRDFIIKKKVKKQRRILLDHKVNLYNRFLAETGIKLSYSTFTRMCPFWITQPKLSDRETCACIKHQNMDLKINALKKVKVISQNNANELINSVVCSKKSEFCMKSLCDKCENKQISYHYETDFRVKYFKWERVTEEKVIKGQKKKIVKTMKKKLIENVSEVCKELNKEMKDFKLHVYNYIHQCSTMKQLKENLGKTEILCRLDFSENYIAKHSEEIQSAHFGASKRQMTLNTVVFYIRNKTGQLETKSFCSISDHLDHQAHAVWAHLEPILQNIGSEYEDTTTIHFYSDGPSSQYKNRYNIYLMKTKVPNYFKNLQSMTWNFTEAGHGKGPMDGIGGVLKRRADEAVRHGNDITCASDFISTLQNKTKICLIEVDNSSVERVKREIKVTAIQPISNITLAKQITWCHKNSTMYSRSLSCFSCKPDKYCDHYTIGRVFENKIRQKKSNFCCDVKKNKTRKRVYHKIYFSSASEAEDEDDPALKIVTTKRLLVGKISVPKQKHGVGISKTADITENQEKPIEDRKQQKSSDQGIRAVAVRKTIKANSRLSAEEIETLLSGSENEDMDI